MSWGIATAYSGLFAGPDRSNRAKEELGTLQMLDQQMKADRQEREANELKEAAYQEQISKFADTLLAGDRDKINRKASFLKGAVRDQIKAFGGDLGQFYANGGHQIMGEYKNSLMNSPESSQYIENKKNMERILDMQSKGLGHLISNIDRQNLHYYQQNNTGKITFSGALSEIKMPNANKYRMGQEIPPEDILAENYHVILGNYMIDNPGSELPSRQQLVGYTRSKHSGAKGDNWQLGMQEQNLAFDKHKFGVTHAETVRRFDLSHDLSVRKQDHEELMSALDNEFKMAQLGMSSSSSGKYGIQSAEDLANAQASAMNFAGASEFMMASVQDQLDNGKGMDFRFWDQAGRDFGKTFESLNDYYTDFSENGSGGNTSFTWAKKVFNNAYKPRQGALILNGAEANLPLEKAGLFQKDKDGFIKLDLSKHQDAYTGSGIKVSAMQTGVNEKGWFTGTYGEQSKNQKFSVVGITGVYTGYDKHGQEQIIMDVNGSSGRNIKRDEKKTKEFDARIDSTRGAKARTMVALKSERGEIVYIPLQSNQMQAIMAEHGASNWKGVATSRNQANKDFSRYSANHKESVQNVAEVKKGINKNAYTAITNQSRMIPGMSSNKGSEYNSLVGSYYATLRPLAGKDTNVGEMINENLFGKLADEIHRNPKLANEIRSITQRSGGNPFQIIDALQRNQVIDGETASTWKANYRYYNQK